jgi:L-amino acid N-acyltransferase YncA
MLPGDRQVSTVVPMLAAHWPRVRAIYLAGIASGDATFETDAPDWPDWDDHHLSSHRFVGIDEAGGVVGWVALSAASDRAVYRGVVEESVYVDPAHQGHGVGRSLLDAVIGSTEAAGIWTIQTGIFPENTASLALHHRVGFATIGVRERVGRHHGRWRDVVLLERRSPLID